jgi:glycosyltransferase involved in cell wall biosynthesis
VDKITTSVKVITGRFFLFKYMRILRFIIVAKFELLLLIIYQMSTILTSVSILNSCAKFFRCYTLNVNITIIIPTLNESCFIEAAVAAARLHSVAGGPHEIIVSDCGSVDGTAGIAGSIGATLVQGCPLPDCRADALNLGALEATGDVLLFLDADTVLPAGYDSLIARALKDPAVVGGAFEFALDGPETGLRLVELINRIRYRIWPRYYGDQCIFVRTDVFWRIGGFPPRRIMEASDFCVSLARLGRLSLIKSCAVTSARRFIGGGIYRVLAGDVRIWWLDMLGLPTMRYASAYRDDNLARGRTQNQA